MNSAPTLFAWDWSRRCLIYPDPIKGHPVTADLELLREAGWKFTETELRRGLPRFDEPPLQHASTIPKRR
jgi:hypothetical protein